ncbi:MAG: hypothetical protein CMI02_19640 [Oceanospirillaceae bacterium]|nr:hypothetical protein [Oceanospirillaceae bacterium]MBT14242.1 hypothetical protein [Oceanospirillaceae bacterium]|tara:strand:+ start:15487 stop:16488 length:1002 start_codon:yes stop_codon:yes gene_type:complete
MYSDEDLTDAVKEGVFSQQAVDDFRQLMNKRRHSVAVDEENFRLITSFNDVFVVIACALLLLSVSWLARDQGDILRYSLVAVTSWGVAEYFVRRRRMALPAIVLLFSFIGSLSLMVVNTMEINNSLQMTIGSLMVAAAAYLHWLRFRVPVTVAAGTVSAIAAVLAILGGLLDLSRDGLLVFVFCAGVCVFLLAMRWDSRDPQRIGHQSAVAFWLHLLAAPLMIHPVFYWSGIIQAESSLTAVITVVLLYAVITLISIAIDRRALMVSSLGYVIYSIADMMQLYGDIESGLALTGLIIGASLLLLSAFWHKARTAVFALLPSSLLRWLPVVKPA